MNLSYADSFEDLVRLPVRANAKQTFDKIVSAGQAIMEASGLEALNSNAVAERAGVTAPVFYHYFKNKHALLYVMADRLLVLQDEAYLRWETAAVKTRDEVRELALLVLQETHAVTKAFVGSRALLVSLRAVPELSDIRVESNRRAAEFYAHQLLSVRTELRREEALERTRLGLEIGYSAVEMLLDGEDLDVSRVLEHTANAIAAIYFE